MIRWVLQGHEHIGPCYSRSLCNGHVTDRGYDILPNHFVRRINFDEIALSSGTDQGVAIAQFLGAGDPPRIEQQCSIGRDPAEYASLGPNADPPSMVYEVPSHGGVKVPRN